jgi:uncharacterized protein YegL
MYLQGSGTLFFSWDDMKLNPGIIIATLVVILQSSCGEPEDMGITPRYSDLSDITTTSIQVNLPRILNTGPGQDGESFEVYVTVTDQDEMLISLLTASNFAMHYSCDEGREICLERFSFSFQRQRIPMAMAITMDYSTSMSADDIRQMEAAVKQFVELLESYDLVQIIKFADQVVVMNGFTSDRSVIFAAIDQSVDKGSTAFYQSIHTGLNNLSVLEDNATDPLFPIVVAFTDGADNSSTVSLQVVMDLSIFFQVPVYTVGLGAVNHTVLGAIAGHSGARYYYTPTAEGIAQAFATISSQVSNYYLLGFVMKEPQCSQMEVTVDVRYRNALGDHEGKGAKSFIFP